MRKISLALFAFTLWTNCVYADDIEIGQITYGGNGCPRGSLSPILSQDKKNVQLIFDRFVAEAGRISNRMLDRKSCNLAIPIHIPDGISISLFQVDYRGFNSLPAGGTSQLVVDFFFAGQKGSSFQKDFAGPLTGEYVASNRFNNNTTFWSPCGEPNVIFRVNSSMIARTNSDNEPAVASVDSATIGAGMKYFLQWRKCRKPY